MPVVSSNYKGPPFYYMNGHFETIIPSMSRKIEGVNYQREQIETPDDDFLNLDWLKNGHEKLLIISHGLEGGFRSTLCEGYGQTLHRKWMGCIGLE